MKYKITYIQRNQVASFHHQNMTKNTPEGARFQAKIQVDDLEFYLKSTPHRRLPHTLLVKTNHPVPPQMEH